MWNTIIANNYSYTNRTAFEGCEGTLESLGYNLVRFESCKVNRGLGDQIGGSVYDPKIGLVNKPIDPLLGSLSQNGGPTPTHALLAGSPAIDAGNPDPAGNGACAEYDQRYLTRPKDGGFDGSAVCDIGAYEYGAPEISADDRAVTESKGHGANAVLHILGPSSHRGRLNIQFTPRSLTR
ncbi:MAG: choice-of-anchor Q domain-containing protein [Chromatiales bacterium]